MLTFKGIQQKTKFIHVTNSTIALLTGVLGITVSNLEENQPP